MRANTARFGIFLELVKVQDEECESCLGLALPYVSHCLRKPRLFNRQVRCLSSLRCGSPCHVNQYSPVEL